MPLYASIDVGSNTVRLLVAETARGRIVREVLNLRTITRLGEGLKEGGGLKPEARERTLKALKDYAARIAALRVKGVSAVGTEALRKALDGGNFVDMVRDKTGLPLEIITGGEEARRTLLGIRAGMEGMTGEARKLLVDIGGGSTELVSTADWDEHSSVSIPLGAVSLYERFLLEDPPVVQRVLDLQRHCYKALAALKGFRPAEGWPWMVGTAGTITTLAAVELGLLEYDPVRVTGLRLGRATVAALLSRFAGLSKESRRLIAGLEPGREDIILSGTALLGVLMDWAGVDSIVVCDWGLREGNLLDYLEKRGGERAFLTLL